MPAEEDQMRWKATLLLALRELQDGVYLYSGREETGAPKRVSLQALVLGSRPMAEVRQGEIH